MALCLIISVFAYILPCEARALLVRHLVPPPAHGGVGVPAAGGLNRQEPGSWMFSPAAAWGLLLHDADLGVPGKTGILDDSVLLDNPVHLNPLFQLIREFRAVDQLDVVVPIALHLARRPLHPRARPTEAAAAWTWQQPQR